MSLYDFKVKDISEKDFDFSTLKGKKVMIVNTASACGFTPQFGELEELYKSQKANNFEIIGFPSNDFGAQDPGSNDEIATFCQKNYGVTFPMMSKVVILGEEASSIYKWMQSELGVEVKWNFHKFLVDENGELVKDLSSRVGPLSDEVLNWIEK
jgi:glutathione peroxidase